MKRNEPIVDHEISLVILVFCSVSDVSGSRHSKDQDIRIVKSGPLVNMPIAYIPYLVEVLVATDHFHLLKLLNWLQ